MNALDTITGNAMAEAAQYWCYKKIVVTIQTGKKTVQRVFPRPYVVIGRDPKCDLVLEDPDLRGHLLYLNANEYGLYCTPLNPESSTLPQGWLAANDWITLGRFKIRACLQDQENETSVPSPSWPRLAEYGSTLAPLPEVAIYRKSELLARRKIRALLTLVGRNEPSLIRIPSRNLSRCHCALFWDSGTLWFIDLKSRSHCFVDGLKRKVGRLDPGVRLKIGQYEIEFVGQEGRYVTPATEVVNTERENAASAVGEEPEKLVNLSSMPNTETPKEALVDALQPLQDPDKRNPQSEDQGDNSTVSTDDVSGDHGPELAEQLAIKTQAFEAAVKTCDALKIDLEQHRARAKESKALLEQKVEELNKELRRARETSAENGVIKDKEREKRKELEETLKQQESIVHQMREQLATGAEEQSDIRSQLNETGNDLKQARSDSQRLLNENKSLSTANETLELKASELQTQIENLAEERRELSSAYSRIEKQSETLNSERDSLEARNHELVQEVQLLQERLSCVDEQTAQKSELETELGTLHQQNAALRERHASLGNELNQQVEDARRQVTELTEHIELEKAEGTRRLEDFEKQRSEMDTRCKTLLAELEDCRDSEAKLEEALSEFREKSAAELRKSEQRHSDLAAQQSGLKEELKFYQAESEKLQETLKEEQAKARVAIQESESGRSLFEKECSRFEKEHSELEKRMDKIVSDASEKQKQDSESYAKLRRRFDDAEKGHRNQLKIAKSLQRDHDRIKAECQRMETALAKQQTLVQAGKQASQEIKGLERQLDQTKRLNTELAERDRLAMEERRKLSEKLENQEEELSRMDLSLKQERHEHAAALIDLKRQLKDLRSDRKSNQTPSKTVLTPESRRDLPTPATESGASDRRVAEDFDRETANETIASPRESRPVPIEGDDYPIAELTSRLTAFGSGKKGLRPLVQRVLVSLIWLIALGLTAGLTWTICTQVLQLSAWPVK